MPPTSSGKSYTLFDGGHLHQKAPIRDGQVTYPGDYPSVNLKILLYNRVEFIQDSQGRFLNELDGQEVTTAGVVNGSSFNYGSFRRHWDLDVEPVKPHDPIFRNRMTKGFRAPNKLKKHPIKGIPDGYDRSFYNPDGFYAQNACALSRLVSKEGWAFRHLVRKTRWTGR